MVASCPAHLLTAVTNELPKAKGKGIKVGHSTIKSCEYCNTEAEYIISQIP